MTVGWQRELLAEVAELVQALQQNSATDVEAVLSELTDSAVHTVPSARYAGITVAFRDGKVRSAAATHEYPVLLDEIQQRHGEGPCLSAAWEQHTIRISDIAREDRWPAYCRDAAEETPIRSIMAFRLFAERKAMAALNFYTEEVNAFDHEAVELGLMCATHTALAWNLVRRDEEFRSALASRDIIGQAKGMLMERFKIDAVQAFGLLKRLSQTSNTPVAVLAGKLIEAERPG